MNTMNGILLALVGGILQGIWGLFLKKREGWAWENSWLIFSLFALLVVPIVWAKLSVPHLLEVIRSLTPGIVAIPLLGGALWGIGGVLYGRALEKIGIGLSLTIVVGMDSALGSIIPLFQQKPSTSMLVVFAVGLLMTLVGTTLSGLAGRLRERATQNESADTSYSAFKTGILLAIASGLFSAMNNISFAYGDGIGKVAEQLGASPQNATLPIFLVVYFGGFWVNFLYALYLLNKNKTFGKFSESGLKPLAGSAIAGIIWFVGIGLYGIATAYLGNMGKSVGYILFVGTVILSGNILGIITNEWKSATKAMRLQLVGSIILILGLACTTFVLFV